MDRRLLAYYNRELSYLRELGGEFAKEFPKIAGRLALDAFECADPYVERLLEGFAFLAARVELKLDAEFPRFSEHMLEMVYPHYLAPTPSMAVVQLSPNRKKGALASGFKVPRGSVLRGQLGKNEQTRCEYRTAHDLELFPIELTSITHSTFVSDIGEVRTPDRRPVKAAVRMRLRTAEGLSFKDLPLDTLPFFVRGQDEVAMRLYELLIGSSVAMVVRDPERTWSETLTSEPVRAKGFDDDEALLPFGARSFQGYRLLHEYFAFPQRYLFVELTGLRKALSRAKGSEIELVILLERHDTIVATGVAPSHLALFCTPAVNLFPRKADSIHLTDRVFEYHVVPDRNRPLDLEVHSIVEVTGQGSGTTSRREFLPFYASRQKPMADEAAAYYTVHRQARVSSSRRRQLGPRSTYAGSETFLSLVDAREGPYRSNLRELTLSVLCTNRDLPLEMTVGEGRTDFSLDSGAPVESVRVVAGPSPPRPSHAWGELTWRLIGHLSLNYLSLSDSADGQGAAAMRELLKLYSDIADPAMQRQVDGLRTVASAPIMRRVPTVGGPPGFARGLEVTVNCDETAFEGTSVFLFGSVLERFLAKYVSINSFTETVLRSVQRGEVMRWPARIGNRPIV